MELLMDEITMLDMPPVLSNCSVLLRNARKREFFSIANGMELNSKPYKYVMRLDNVPLHAGIRVDLVKPFDANGKYTEHIIENGIVLEKLIGVQESIVDLRMSFQTFSYSHNNSMFFLNVWVNQNLVYTSDMFELLARRHRKRTKKAADL